MINRFKNLMQLLDYFKDEQTCISYLEQQRWGGNVECPHCGNGKVYRTNRGFKCANKYCYKKFSVTVGLVCENTKIPLRVWFGAIYLATAHKKGISSCQLARDMGITQRTAWFLLHRIRTMVKEKDMKKLTGIVEIDETYVGGKEPNKHENKRSKKPVGLDSKTAVMGMIQRDGMVRTMVIPSTKVKVMQGTIRKNIDKNATLITDAHASYKSLWRSYEHVMVKTNHNTHRTDRYFHTNNIEGYWSHLKRGIIGIYHYVSPKHLQKYCDEFAYRYNTRTIADVDRFELSVRNAQGRLKYKELTANNGKTKTR